MQCNARVRAGSQRAFRSAVSFLFSCVFIVFRGSGGYAYLPTAAAWCVSSSTSRIVLFACESKRTSDLFGLGINTGRHQVRACVRACVRVCVCVWVARGVLLDWIVVVKVDQR